MAKRKSSQQKAKPSQEDREFRAQRRKEQMEISEKWLSTYKGSNIVADYSSHFGVRGSVAIKALKELGHEIPIGATVAIKEMWDKEIHVASSYFEEDDDSEELTREKRLDKRVLEARQALPAIRLEYSDLTESEKARIKDSFEKTIAANDGPINYPISRKDRKLLIDWVVEESNIRFRTSYQPGDKTGGRTPGRGDGDRGYPLLDIAIGKEIEDLFDNAMKGYMEKPHKKKHFFF
ncbi:MAG: hypothetical protein LBC41_17940 [Clostridiales bacterium]|jgi:hypothetical protein|nr:hypothetical protein [Clostridiales bacterium]MDR2752540.1 hypothetical protein [Clostridiales bacterium]